MKRRKILLCVSFVTCLEKLQLLNQGVSGVSLDPNYKELNLNFLESFEDLHEKINDADKIINNSGYKIKDLDSDICGEKLKNFVHHLNSYNLSTT